MIDHSYPKLNTKTADYEYPDCYSTEMRQQGDEMEVIHTLKNVNCLPGQLLRDGLAELGCEVRVPQMLYSIRHKCGIQSVPLQGEAEFKQRFAIPKAYDKRMYFIPAMILSRYVSTELMSSAHGVSSIWDRQFVHFPKGAVIAGGIVHEDPKSIEHLLRFDQDDSLEEGTVRADSRFDPDSWVFVVRVPAEILGAIQDPHNHSWARTFFIGCLAQMLVAVSREFGRHGQSHTPPASVEKLGEMVLRETGRRQPWKSDDNEWEDALHIATSLRGLHIPTLDENPL